LKLFAAQEQQSKLEDLPRGITCHTAVTGLVVVVATGLVVVVVLATGLVMLVATGLVVVGTMVWVMA